MPSIIDTIRADKARCCFVFEQDVETIVTENGGKNRLQLLLVRCGNGRFICPAQDVKHFIDIITKEKTDYIRDVSLYTA